MRKAPRVILDPESRAELLSWFRPDAVPTKQRLRAQVVLLAGDGLDHTTIAQTLGISRQRCARIRDRFIAEGVDALRHERSRPGRPPVVDAKKIVKLTKKVSPATALGWSRSLMAKATGASPSTVGRVWRKFGLTPPRRNERPSVAHDPYFFEKLDVFFGLFLGLPRRALVLCADEGQEREMLSMFRPRHPLPDVDHGPNSRSGSPSFKPLAALNPFHQSVVAAPSGYRRFQEWLRFLKQIDAQTPASRELHLIVDGDEHCEHATVKAWLQNHPRLHLHFTPSPASWLTLIELFFEELAARRGGRTGAFRKVTSLEHAITDYIRMHGDSSEPFIWIAKTSDLLRDPALA